MLDWLKNNLSTIIIGAIVGVIIAAALYFSIKSKKNGKLCYGCKNCPTRCNEKDKK